jgi:hypothetical protein
MRWLVALALAAALVACKSEDSNLERARTLMGSGQWANARTALGRVLEQRAHDPTARGLLLYCLEREDGLAAVAELELYGLFKLAVVVEAPTWSEVPKSMRDYVGKTLTDARKALFDKGLDTTDVADLRKVITAAARWAFAHEKEVTRRDVAAAILAFQGEAEATAQLIERLKSQEPERIVGYLVDVGPPATESLRRAVDDAGFIGRAAAREALARILAEDRARALVRERPELRDPSSTEVTLPGHDRLRGSMLSMLRDPSVMRVHARYADLDPDGLVLLQSWNDSKARLVAELYVLAGGALRRVQAKTADGKPFDLEQRAALYGLERDHEWLTLRRMQERTADVEVETGRVARPEIGMRVRLSGHVQHGTIVRADEGLWVVRVDLPLEGMTELPVAASSLIGLRTERRTERACSRMTCSR